MTTAGTLDIRMLPAAAAADAGLMAQLTDLVNGVYAVAEKGLWADGAVRTRVEAITELARAGQIAVARLRGQIVGCIRIHLLGDGVGEFGMLAVIPTSRGTGVGRDLVAFAEQAAKRRRCHTMQLEVLVPRAWTHPSKDFLTDWYTRSGYKLARGALILADRGDMDLDAPVASYWPEFGVAGKGGVLVRHVLGHTAGVPDFAGPISAADLYDW